MQIYFAVVLDHMWDEWTCVLEISASFTFSEIDASRFTTDDPRAGLDDSALYLRQLMVKLVNGLTLSITFELLRSRIYKVIIFSIVRATKNSNTLTAKQWFSDPFLFFDGRLSNAIFGWFVVESR